MSNIGPVIEQDSLVLTRGRDFKWTFENLGEDSKTPEDFPAGDLYFELETGGEHNCLQQIEVLNSDSGEYKLVYDGVPSDPIEYYDATDTPYDLTIDIRSALENVPAIGPNNVLISRTGLNPVWNLNMTLAGTNQNEIQELSVVNLLGWLGQQLGEGRMVLSYRENDAEAPISFESNAATIQASLESIPQIGVGNVTVTSLTNGKFKIEFIGLLSARDIDQIKVRAYEADKFDFFGGGTVGTLLTVISTKTTQNGRKAILTGRMMDLLTQKVNDFFKLFDDSMPLTLEFVIKDNTHFTIVCRSTKGYTEIDLVTFDVIFSAAMFKTFLENQTLLKGAVSAVTVDQYWNHSYTVEFVNEAANRPHPLLVGDATGLRTKVTAIPLVPRIRSSMIDRGQRNTTVWDFVIDGSRAVMKIESEDADLIANRTPFQLVFLPEGEAAGGDPVTRGKVQVQE